MKEDFPYGRVHNAIGVIGGFIGAQYVKTEIHPSLWTAVLYPIGGAFLFMMGFVFADVLFQTLQSKIGEKLTLALLLTICIFIALSVASKNNLVPEDFAIETAYKDGYNDGEKKEFNDSYYDNVFRDDYGYKVH